MPQIARSARPHFAELFPQPTICLVFVLAAVGCAGPLEDSIHIDGSSTVFPLSMAVAEAFGGENPSIGVSVAKSGTGGGFERFIAGEVDICDASRPITDDEKKRCAAAGIEYVELLVASDGLAVVANPQSDWLDHFTMEELQTIWRSDNPAKTWSDVREGWPNETIKLFGPDAQSGTYDFFVEAVLDKKSPRIDDAVTASAEDNTLVIGVEGEKFATGYFGFAYYAENQDSLKLVPIDAGEGPVAPSDATVIDGTYPLARPLFIYVNRATLDRPAVAKFVAFYLDQAAEFASLVHYVPTSPEVAAEQRAKLASPAKSAD